MKDLQLLDEALRTSVVASGKYFGTVCAITRYPVYSTYFSRLSLHVLCVLQLDSLLQGSEGKKQQIVSFCKASCEEGARHCEVPPLLCGRRYFSALCKVWIYFLIWCRRLFGSVCMLLSFRFRSSLPEDSITGFIELGGNQEHEAKALNLSSFEVGSFSWRENESCVN